MTRLKLEETKIPLTSQFTSANRPKNTLVSSKHVNNKFSFLGKFTINM